MKFSREHNNIKTFIHDYLFHSINHFLKALLRTLIKVEWAQHQDLF